MENDKSKVTPATGSHRPIHGLRCSCVLATVFIALLLLPVTAEILFHSASIPMHEAPLPDMGTEADTLKLRKPALPRSHWRGEWRMPMTARPIVRSIAPDRLAAHPRAVLQPDITDIIARTRPLLC